MTTLRSFQAEIDSFANDQHKAHLRDHQQQVATATTTTKGTAGKDGKVKTGGGGGDKERVDDGLGGEQVSLEVSS
jgi:hypothetical protein